MDWRQLFNALELHQYALIHDEIGSIACVDAHALVDQRHRPLAHRTQPSEPQLVTHTLPVRRLQKPGPQLPMHLDPRADDLARDRIPLCPRCLGGYALGSWRWQLEAYARDLAMPASIRLTTRREGP